MTLPAVLDVDELLAPITGEDPVGEYLRWEDEYAELEEARRADEDAGGDDVWSRDRKTSDWPSIRKLGCRLLAEKTKDLQIAAWVAESVAHVHGLVGVRDGLRLILGLQEAYWEAAHPERGDLDLREGVYEFIDHERIFPLLVRSAVVTYVPSAPDYTYTFLQYEESRKTEILARAKYESDEHREAALEGRLTGERFDEAVQATTRGFYADLLATCEECLAVVEQINQGIADRWKGPNRPRLSRLEEVLLALRKFARQTLAKKPEEKPDEPEPEPEPDTDSWSESESDGWSATAEDGAESVAETDDGWSTPAPEAPTTRRPARRAPKGKIEDADDARERIAEAAHFLRSQNPDDPTSYLVLRGLALGGVFQTDGLEPDQLAAPSSEVREKLFLTSRSEDDENRTVLIDEAERAMGRPEGRGWLDLHWYAAQALEGLGRDAAARACRAVLRACLEERRDWPEAHLRDGTPCASRGASEWLKASEILGEPAAADEPWSPPRPSRPMEPEPAATADASVESRPVDAWDRAQELLREGDAAGALSLMAKAAGQAGSGRERFLRTLQQAELCLALRRDTLALPLLENLARRIDERRLDEWEEPGLCARVFSSLYRCLRGRDEARAAAVYDRLCQLDIGLAIQIEGS